MTDFPVQPIFPVKPIVTLTRPLARSALPDAPVVPDKPRARIARTLSARLLRSSSQ